MRLILIVHSFFWALDPHGIHFSKLDGFPLETSSVIVGSLPINLRDLGCTVNKKFEV